VKKALVVGGGIGGLTSAIALRRVGMETDLLEIQPRWNVYGVGIVQQANVVRAMAQLGIADEYLSAGFGFDKVKFWNSAGEQLGELPSPRLTGLNYPAMLGISRRALHRVLVSAAERLGTRIRMGVSVDALDQSNEHVAVHCTDGIIGIYDLVVGADGLHSRIRKLVFGDQWRPRLMGQSVWRHNFPREPEIDCLTDMMGAGFLPMSDSDMYMYLTTAEPGNPHFSKQQLPELMRQRLARFGGLIAQLRPQITRPAEVVYRPLEAILMPKPWHRGSVVLIGDAAHATTPHMAQGAGMAIEDSVVLAEECATGAPAADCLERFMSRRWERCKTIWESSISICEAQVAGRHDIDFPGAVKRMYEVTSQPI
jgi:2-polyprenyl-6-methoxyphenol hydroxylase-like FAD-dependent oxidoreductase